MDVPTARQRKPRNLDKRKQNGFDSKPRVKRNANRIRKKFKKGNGFIAHFLKKNQHMKEIKITIEKSSDSFGAYSENVPGIFGAGDTAEECKQSILDAIETIKTFDESQIPEILKGEYTIVYKFDIVSLLNYYKGIFTNSAFEKITGINQRQIQHYSSGKPSPRPKQREKIEKALHKLGNELLAVEL